MPDRTNSWDRFGKRQHRDELEKTIDYLKKQGFHVINLQNKSPDAIATKDGKLYAIEVLGQTHMKRKGYKNNFTYKAKLNDYSMFDFVIVRVFDRENPTPADGTKTRVIPTTTPYK